MDIPSVIYPSVWFLYLFFSYSWFSIYGPILGKRDQEFYPFSHEGFGFPVLSIADTRFSLQFCDNRSFHLAHDQSRSPVSDITFRACQEASRFSGYLHLFSKFSFIHLCNYYFRQCFLITPVYFREQRTCYIIFVMVLALWIPYWPSTILNKHRCLTL